MPAEAELQATPSGLRYVCVQPGEGAAPGPADEVTVHYAGWLLNGKGFDSSYGRGKPASFPLNRVIAGWTEGVQLMRPGAIYKFVIPPELAYGHRGAPPKIGPGETLLFQIELIGVK